ncbi:hypothetical protein ACWEF6_02725 [Amycolatopsis sp. NPDC004772]
MSTCTTPGHEDRHRPEHQWICNKCVRQLADDLAAATDLWDDLTVTLTRQDEIGGDGRGSSEPALPFKPSAGEAMWVLAQSLGSVASDLSLALGMQFPLNPVRWLAANTDKLAGSAEAGRLVDEIRSAVRLARATIDRPPELVFAGRCPADTEDGQCPGMLYARPTDDVVACGECGAQHEVRARRQRMLDAAAVLDVSKAKALVWIRVLMDREIPDGTWRQWRSNRKLHVSRVVEGQELFRFGDVRDLAVGWVARKRAA